MENISFPSAWLPPQTMQIPQHMFAGKSAHSGLEVQIHLIKMIKLVTVIKKELFIPVILGWVSPFRQSSNSVCWLKRPSKTTASQWPNKEEDYSRGEKAAHGGKSKLHGAVLESWQTRPASRLPLCPRTICHFILCPTCSKNGAFRNSFLLL